MTHGPVFRLVYTIASQFDPVSRNSPRRLDFRFGDVETEQGAYNDTLRRYRNTVPKGNPEVRFLLPPRPARRLYTAFSEGSDRRRDTVADVISAHGLATDTPEDWDLIGSWIARNIEPNRELRPTNSRWGKTLVYDRLRPSWRAFTIDLSLLYSDNVAQLKPGSVRGFSGDFKREYAQTDPFPVINFPSEAWTFSAARVLQQFADGLITNGEVTMLLGDPLRAL